MDCINKSYFSFTVCFSFICNPNAIAFLDLKLYGNTGNHKIETTIYCKESAGNAACPFLPSKAYDKINSDREIGESEKNCSTSCFFKLESVTICSQIWMFNLAAKKVDQTNIQALLEPKIGDFSYSNKAMFFHILQYRLKSDFMGYS